MKIWSHDSANWQHNNKPLVFAAWGNNNIVKTLSNSHGPEILLSELIVNRKRRGNNGKRERLSPAVP